MKTTTELNELAGALSNAQGLLRDAFKGLQGYGYKYADLAAILEIVRPIFSDNGLSVIQSIKDGKDGFIGVETMLLHSSGQYISDKYEMPVEPMKGCSMAQSYGAIVTYARRYALAAMCGIAQTDTDASPQVKPPADLDEGAQTNRDVLLKFLLTAANQGYKDFAKAWKKLTELERSTVGVSKFNELKSLSKEAANEPA